MKKMLLFFCVMVILSMSMIPALAAGGIDSGVAGEVGEILANPETTDRSAGTSQKTDTFEHSIDPEYLLGIEGGDYSVDTILAKLQPKGEGIIRVVKTISCYICLGAFIVSCVLMLVGIIGNPRLIFKSFIGALVAGLCYGAIVCAEPIVHAIASWGIM